MKKFIIILISFIVIFSTVFCNTIVIQAFDLKVADVNNDGKINPVDALIVLRCSVDLSSVSSLYGKGDVDQNGKINSNDAITIIRYSVGDDITATKPDVEAPVFSVTKISETKNEIKLSFNLESGSFTALDLQINSRDYNHDNKTTGLELASIARSQNYKEYATAHENDKIPSMIAINQNYGKASFISIAPYDVIGSMLIYTFRKSVSANSNVSASNFIAKINSCTDNSYNVRAPQIIINWEAEECKHVLSHVTVAATCSAEGEEYDRCTKCGDTFNYKKLAKKPHQWGSWAITVQPTAEKEGYEVRMCSVCETIEKRKIAKIVANVKSVSVSDLKLDYKKSATITTEIEADKGAQYTVKYSSSDEKIARVNENGKVYAAKKGTATITCTVTDSNGNTVTDTCNVSVKYNFGQWLIVIILFGWIWY